MSALTPESALFRGNLFSEEQLVVHKETITIKNAMIPLCAEFILLMYIVILSNSIHQERICDFLYVKIYGDEQAPKDDFLCLTELLIS
jgi:hypothetical protein